MCTNVELLTVFKGELAKIGLSQKPKQIKFVEITETRDMSHLRLKSGLSDKRVRNYADIGAIKCQCNSASLDLCLPLCYFINGCNGPLFHNLS